MKELETPFSCIYAAHKCHGFESFWPLKDLGRETLRLAIGEGTHLKWINLIAHGVYRAIGPEKLKGPNVKRLVHFQI